MSIFQNFSGGVQGLVGEAGKFLDQVKDNKEFIELAKKLQVEPFLMALDQVNGHLE
ncbi:hypothetical protein [Lyngbya confervoides]|uniref:Uncharacterized protein n=1 Tax=Lyngbya confervoides BDU141951 TaxID=1574623 RepID=A0ABD4T5U8_9CYAN|nr:hypothetical protein [Lyngbya confervoides]MCM1983969.1 hypothetical protein [Lyngbya confervoides BDU141951]